MKTEIVSEGAPKAIGPYSAAIAAGDFVFCSGQIGADPKTGELAMGITAQTARALENLDGVLKVAGLGLKDLVKTTVFLMDLSDFKMMNDEYMKHFEAPYPARSAIAVPELPRGARVEIEGIAVAEKKY